MTIFGMVMKSGTSFLTDYAIENNQLILGGFCGTSAATLNALRAHCNLVRESQDSIAEGLISISDIKDENGEMVIETPINHFDPKAFKDSEHGYYGYRMFMNGRKEQRFFHMLLMHEMFFRPYQDRTFLLGTDTVVEMMGKKIHEIVRVPVFPKWYPYLWQRGAESGNIQTITNSAPLRVYKLTHIRDVWERIIADGLKNKQIKLVE